MIGIKLLQFGYDVLPTEKKDGKFRALAGKQSPSLPKLFRVISIPRTVLKDGLDPSLADISMRSHRLLWLDDNKSAASCQQA